MLTFDSRALFKDFVDQAIIPAANEIMENVYEDIQDGLRTNPHTKSKKGRASPDDVRRRIARANDMRTEVIASCVSYGMALIDSYGTGAKMDLDNDELTEYIGSSLWNPLRHGLPIAGRKEGIYTNFFGAEVESTGRKAGESIGGWGRGIMPTYAIQNAEKRLDFGLDGNGWAQRILNYYTEQFFDTVDCGEYFKEEPD